MNSIAISLEGSQNVITEFNNSLENNDIEKTEPVQKDSLADPLDAPLGADEIKGIIEIITLIFKGGTTVLGFWTVLKPILIKNPKEVVVLRDPKSGKKVGSLTKDSTECDIQNFFPNDSNI